MSHQSESPTLPTPFIILFQPTSSHSLPYFTSSCVLLTVWIYLVYLFVCAKSCGMQDLLIIAGRIKFSDKESNLGPLHWEPGVLTTGPPSSLNLSYFFTFYCCSLLHTPNHKFVRSPVCWPTHMHSRHADTQCLYLIGPQYLWNKWWLYGLIVG